MNIFQELALLLFGAERQNNLSASRTGTVNLGDYNPRTVVRHGNKITYDENKEYVDGSGKIWDLTTDDVYERYRDNPSGGNDNPNCGGMGYGYSREHK